MQRLLVTVVGSAILVANAACFHATIETGAPPSAQTVSKSFAAGWLFGLVPPSTVETAAKCPNGVAKVETQLSFVNQLVAFLTIEIYTPMNIEVTCAEAKSADASHANVDRTVATTDGAEAVQRAFASAASEAVSTRKAVLVQVR